MNQDKNSWALDDELIEAEIKERLRLAGRLDWDPLLPHPAWFESWQKQLMETLEKKIEKPRKVSKHKEHESSLCRKL